MYGRIYLINTIRYTFVLVHLRSCLFRKELEKTRIKVVTKFFRRLRHIKVTYRFLYDILLSFSEPPPWRRVAGAAIQALTKPKDSVIDILSTFGGRYVLFEYASRCVDFVKAF